jgi:hypothetical protein
MALGGSILKRVNTINLQCRSGKKITVKRSYTAFLHIWPEEYQTLYLQGWTASRLISAVTVLNNLP